MRGGSPRAQRPRRSLPYRRIAARPTVRRSLTPAPWAGLLLIERRDPQRGRCYVRLCRYKPQDALHDRTGHPPAVPIRRACLRL